MRLHRFYVLQPLGEEVVIDDVSLVSQWTKVFRYQLGDFVILFNGDGNDYCYSLKSISKKQCTLIRTKTTPSYIPPQTITLYLSLIKKDNFELVVQKATELGVSSIVPIISERSEKKNLSFERLTKIAIEASEQCGRGDIPQISEITTLGQALNDLPQEVTPVMFTMGGADLGELSKNKSGVGTYALFIGPEGGWGEHDLELFKQKDVKQYSLGKTVLRAETAGIAVCAYMSLYLG